MSINFQIWKPVKGYEGFYEVSAEGEIRSTKPRYKNAQVLKPSDNGRGHQLVVLCRNGQKKSKQVSRIVFEAFYGEIPEGKEIDHKNEDTRDNRLENLQAIPHHQNMVRGTAVERSAYDHRKPVKAYSDGQEVAHFASIKEASLLTGLNATMIGQAAAGKRDLVGGYKWIYAEAPTEKPKKLYER